MGGPLRAVIDRENDLDPGEKVKLRALPLQISAYSTQLKSLADRQQAILNFSEGGSEILVDADAGQ
jgi:hypothetical protein